MFFVRLPKFFLQHNFPFFRKASDPLNGLLSGLMTIFIFVGALWLTVSTLRYSGLFYDALTDTSRNNPYPPIRGEAFVQFDFGVKPSRAFRGSVIDGMTLSETVQQAAVAGNFDVAWQPLVIIDGVSDGMHNKRWVFYKNETRLSESPATAPVNPRDEIFARFE